MTDVNKKIDELIKDKAPHYGRAMCRLRSVSDKSQKEAAAMLNMTPQQLSTLEQKENWTDEQKERVCKAFNIPESGFDYLANEPDLLNSIYIFNNTQGDNGNILSGSIGQNVNNNFENSKKADDLLNKLDVIIDQWGKQIQFLQSELSKYTSK